MMNMNTSKLVEVCPQCMHGVNTPIARLVSDFCGHKKCRICLLQEADGCRKCLRDSSKSFPSAPESNPQPQRKTVITSTHKLQIVKKEDSNQTLPKNTETEKEILFPAQWVNKTSGNFIHLKRSISERYFKEGRRNKEDKCCGTDSTSVESDFFINLPSHIHYFCALHRVALTEEQSFQQHVSCSEGDENLFTCCHCNVTFENSYKLNRHNRCHAPSSKYQCDVCLKYFKDNYALRTHYRKHSGDKVFACHLCDVKLAQLWSLKRHLEKHNGERNYPCESCDMRFKSKEDLKRHMASHSVIKLFSCRKCGAKFKFQRSLTRHTAMHAKVKSRPIECSYCGATFKRKDNLTRHFQNIHQNQRVHCD